MDDQTEVRDEAAAPAKKRVALVYAPHVLEIQVSETKLLWTALVVLAALVVLLGFGLLHLGRQIELTSPAQAASTIDSGQGTSQPMPGGTR